jgi:hypothetical protein
MFRSGMVWRQKPALHPHTLFYNFFLSLPLNLYPHMGSGLILSMSGANVLKTKNSDSQGKHSNMRA